MVLLIVGIILLIAVIIVTTLMILSIKNKVDDVSSNKLPDLDDGLDSQEEIEVMKDIIDKDSDILIEGIDEKAIKEQLMTKDSNSLPQKNNKGQLPSLSQTEGFSDMCESLNQEELEKEVEY